RLLADDVTEERLACLMAEQGGRMCIASDEDTILQNVAGRYASGRSSFNVFLKGYSGTEPITYDRKKDSQYFTVRRPRLSVVITVQPSVIEGLAKDRTMKEKGLLGRFLYSIPPSMVGDRATDTLGVPPELGEAYRQLVRSLSSLPAPGEDEDIPRLRLSAEAREMHTKLQQWIEPRLRPRSGDLFEITSWANKFCGNVARIAGVLHCVEHRAACLSLEVSGDTMFNAIRIGMYLLEHAKGAFGAMGRTDAEADAAMLEAWLRSNCAGTSFTRRVVYKSGPHPLRDAKKLGAALEFLVETGVLKAAGSGWQLAG
ncbi:MAG: DUF3987 domain-containing protein, partial [Myxococcales bacterium]|nr:DUF3987 domain-containing protein [Myxococcales bacterium]